LVRFGSSSGGIQRRNADDLGDSEGAHSMSITAMSVFAGVIIGFFLAVAWVKGWL